MSDYRIATVNHNGIDCIRVMIDPCSVEDFSGISMITAHIPVDDVQKAIDAFRLPVARVMKSITIEYACHVVTFPCMNCGHQGIELRRRSPGVVASGAFCPTCNEQYFISWDDGVLRRGMYECVFQEKKGW